LLLSISFDNLTSLLFYEYQRIDSNHKMIIAQKKSLFSLAAFLLLMFGVMATILVLAKGNATAFLENPVLFTFLGIAFISVFYILPIYNLILKTDIIIDKRELIIKNYPFINQKVYKLKDLVEWQLLERAGRYGSTTHLYLVFSNKEKINIWESEITNFDLLSKYFNSEYRRLKKIKQTTANTAFY
jgi:hypothetical protein